MPNSNVTESNLNPADIWRLPLILTSLLIVALLLIYYPTTVSMIRIWSTSDTFAHGYLILPLSIWLIWRNKYHFYNIIPAPNYYAIPLILMASFGWLIAYFVDVQVVQQLALVSLIPLVILAVLGWEVVKAAAFPLFFLVFAVPMGEALVPTLIDFTADFTVSMVQMTGIPVYREGTFFQLPTGNWSVVEACSGVRYLIASVVLGFLYAYLTYQSIYRRMAFIAAAIVIPIIANGLRAFMIVMIGHFSDMKLATGVDHLVYGWVFFGIVIMIMFYIGSFWREDEVDDEEQKMPEQTVGSQQQRNKKQYIFSTIIILLVVGLLPVKAYTDSVDEFNVRVIIEAPLSNDWKLSDQLESDWEPRYKNMDATLHKNYQQGEVSVDLFIGYYQAQREGAQLITSINVLTEEDDEWKKVKGSTQALLFYDGTHNVAISQLNREPKELLVISFYFIGERVVHNDYIAKLIEAKTRLLGKDRASSVFAISTAIDGDRELALSNIQLFINSFDQQMFRAIKNVKIEE